MDNAIEDNYKAALISKGLDKQSIRYDSKNGVLTLKGSVKSPDQRKEAEQVADNVPNVEQVKKLATMPSREQMLAELGAGLQSPMAAFVGALSGLLYMFAGALEGLRVQKQSA